MSDVKLLPCPFCGAEGENGHTAVWWVSCVECGADGPTADTEGEAAVAWNTRGERKALQNIVDGCVEERPGFRLVSHTLIDEARRALET
jgi:hypothetical protein